MDDRSLPVKRCLLALAVIALAACAQPAHDASEALQPCAALQMSGELTPGECRLEASGQTLHVRFAELAAGMQSGSVSVDVIGSDGQVDQTLLEADVSEYKAPSVQDVDGDGRGDILIPLMTGNVNTEYAVWLYSGAEGRFERVGAVSGVEITRTDEGYVAVPARSSAAAWAVAFYRLDQEGLHPLVTLQLDGEEDGGAVRSTCTVQEAPGLAALGLSERAAQEKFCAEPAAQVFAP